MLFRNRMTHPGVWFNQDPNAGGGGGGTGTGTGTAGGDDAAGRERVEATVRRLMAEGRAQERLVELHIDNHNLRTENAKLKGRAEVPEGGRILSKAEAAELDGYRALGKLEDVKKTVTEAPTLAAKLAERDFRDLSGEAATLLTWNGKVLADLLTSKDLELKLEDAVVADGKGGTTTKKVPQVRPKGQDGAAFQPLDVYAQANLADYLPALMAKAPGAAGGSAGGTGGAPYSGTPFPGQSGGGTPPKPGGLVDEFLREKEQRAAKGNPLDRKPATTATATT